jgi:hypothetical protein
MVKRERKGALKTYPTTLRPPLEEEDDKASKDARHLQKAQDARVVDPLIVLIFREEGAPPATLISRFSEGKCLHASMSCLPNMRLSYEYVERLVGGMIVLGLVLGGKSERMAGSGGKDVWVLDSF